MKHPCLECGLRYSSYCMGCENKPFGIGQIPIIEPAPRKNKRKDANKNGQTCTLAEKDCKYS